MWRDLPTVAAREELARNAHIFAAAVREVLETRFLREAAGFPLSVSQLHLLKLVALHGEHPVGEVAAFLGVSAAAASKNVEKLVRLGLVTRSTPEEDRRIASLRISPRGREVLDGYDSRERALLESVVGDLGEEDAAALARLLERCSLALLASDGDGVGSCLRCGAHYRADCPVHILRGRCPYASASRRARRTTP